MPEFRIVVRDRFGQSAEVTAHLDVIKAPAGPAEPRKVGRHRRVRLGQILIEAGIITQAQLEEALARQQQTGERLGHIIMGMGLGSQEGLAAAIGQQLRIPFIRLRDVPPEEAALLKVPEHIARRHSVIPLQQKDRTLVLGMVDPADIVAVDEIRRLTGLDVEPVVITPEDFNQALSGYPTLNTSADVLIREFKHAEVGEAEPATVLQAVADEAPIVRLANLIITQAVRQAASDIHVEPLAQHMRVRYRIDGVMQSAMTPPSHVHAALVSRFKIMAAMNIAERRVPQDGRIEFKIDDRDIDLRVSTVPTSLGEKVVMRILDKRGAVVGIDKLGMLPGDLQRFERIISKPYGIILVTGPTGSGKTTTLYSVLNRLNKTNVNITTIEDPVEYQLPGINQVQINPKAGFSFAIGLRAFLRQDPDIIMVGEIRDEETARIAVHAALTGHLVLSTLHTNDAAGAVMRLTGIGIEPFLVASSLVGVVAQRLVRSLCERCREPHTPSERLLESLGLAAREKPPTFYRSAGCAFCNQTGYKGRIGVFETMPMDQLLEELVARGATSDELRAAAIEAGMRTLEQDVIDKVARGATSLEEARRVILMGERSLGRPGYAPVEAE